MINKRIRSRNNKAFLMYRIGGMFLIFSIVLFVRGGAENKEW